MHAVILAAGRARRMRPLSDGCHKAMLEVAGTTILARVIADLQAVAVDRATVVTGYRAREVEEHVRAVAPGWACRFVENVAWRTTNNIVSLGLALDALALDDAEEDVLLVECDLLLTEGLLQHLGEPRSGNAALLSAYRPGMDGTVVSVADGLLTRVIPPAAQGPAFEYRGTWKTLNAYRFSHPFCRDVLAPGLRAQIDRGDVSSYYEAVLAGLGDLAEHRISAVQVDHRSWAEVDDPNDLAGARFRFDPGHRAEVLDRALGGHWSLDVLDFAFMRNVRFPPPAMLASMRHALPELLASYGSTQRVLDEKLGWFLGCRPERLVTLSGATQAFPVLRRLWAGRRVALPTPTFGEYPSAFPGAVTYRDAPGIDEGELDELARHVDVLVVVNPNSPTGTTLSTAALHALAARHPGTRVLVDESFAAFDAQPSLRRRLDEAPLENVVILCSLSKALGVPGLRLGYLHTADRELVEAVARELPVWGVGSHAEFLLEEVLKFRRELDASLVQTRADRKAFAHALDELEVVAEVHPSGGDFLLVRLHGAPGAAGRLRRALLAQPEAMDVRDVSAKLADGREHLRLAVRLPEENLRLVAAMRRLAAPAP